MRSVQERGRLLVGLVLMSCIASVGAICFTADDAEAQRARRGRGRRAAAAPQEAPESAAIAPALGEFQWGLSPAETFNHVKAQIEQGYRERIALAARTDAIQEDRLRQEMTNEARRVRGTFVRFRGEASGWDTSFIRDEFTHGNNESMMVWRDEVTHSQRYYFFINDRLWKVFQAFDASVFAGVNFAQFAEAIQGRFGRGVERTGVLVEGGPSTQWVEWQDETTRLRAVDHTRFYGFFCLVFEDKGTVGRLSQLRANTIARGSDGHALVESVLRGENEDDVTDQHADVADRISGQIRRRSDAPESSGPARAGTAPASAGSTAGGPAAPRADPDDPFAGMDL